MKKVVAYFFLTLISFHAGLIYPLFFYRKAVVKNEIRKLILQANDAKTIEGITVLILKQSVFNNLKWFEEGREFMWEGKMFDIIETQADFQGLVKVVALEDGKEMALFQILKKKQEDRNSRSGEGNSWVPIFLYCLPHDLVLNLVPCESVILNITAEKSWVSFEPGVPAPPPQKG